MVSDRDDEMESFIRGSKSNNDGSKDDSADNTFLSFPLSMKPMYAVAQSRHPRTRDDSLTVLIVLVSSAIDRNDGIKVELVRSDNPKIIFFLATCIIR